MSPFEWIKQKLESGVSKSALRMMYKVFVKETSSTMKYESYRRAINKMANKLGQQALSYPETDPRQKEVATELSISGDRLDIKSTECGIIGVDDIIKKHKIDMTKWTLEGPAKIKTWGMGFKDSNGEGKILPLTSVSASFVLISDDTDSEKEVIESLIEKMKTYAPKYPTIIPEKAKSGNALELCLFDHHFGQLSWGKETGSKNYDLKIAKQMAMDAVEYIISQAKHFDIEKIIVPFANDFFNVNDKTNTTVKGTPQDEDARWIKTFDSGVDLWIFIFEALRSVAKVEGLWIPGNHDEERSYYLAALLKAWFHNSDIEINNGPKPQKVITWGANAVMYTHGCNERKSDYPAVFATTFPQEFAKAKYRAIHLGDKHHLNKSSLTANEDVYSIDVKIKPTLVPLNAWSAGKAYRAIARTEAEVWNKKDGLIADLYYNDL